MLPFLKIAEEGFVLPWEKLYKISFEPKKRRYGMFNRKLKKRVEELEEKIKELSAKVKNNGNEIIGQVYTEMFPTYAFSETYYWEKTEKYQWLNIHQDDIVDRINGYMKIKKQLTGESAIWIKKENFIDFEEIKNRLYLKEQKKIEKRCENKNNKKRG